MYKVFQVSPSRHLDAELRDRLQISGNRFLVDLLEGGSIYFGEKPNHIFENLKAPSYNTALDILILVSCHGKQSENGNFKDRKVPAVDSFTRITAEKFWSQLKVAVKALPGKKFIVLFAQCYGSLMSNDLNTIIANDTDTDIEDLKTRVKVHGLSVGPTHRTKADVSKPIGAQTVHKEFLIWVLSQVVYNEDQWIQWFQSCIPKNKPLPAELTLEFVLSFLRHKIREDRWLDLVEKCVYDPTVKFRLLNGANAPVDTEEEMEAEI